MSSLLKRKKMRKIANPYLKTKGIVSIYTDDTWTVL